MLFAFSESFPRVAYLKKIKKFFYRFSGYLFYNIFYILYILYIIYKKYLYMPIIYLYFQPNRRP